MREIMDRRLVLAEAKLTPLQRQVLSLVGEGKTDKQIALALKIDETTTGAQIRSILRILGVPPDNQGERRVRGRDAHC
jgi:DNA-binding CsgD family transcriptional regulator